MKTQENLDATLKVRTALLNLQKELLNYLKDGFEKENARAVAPTEWLRELTSLVIDIDVLTELQELSIENIGIARAEVERLFFTADSDSEFSKHYMQLMKQGAPFIVAHSYLREAAHQMAAPTKTLALDESVAIRKKWHEEHFEQVKKRRS
jgi:hypothetical protein